MLKLKTAFCAAVIAGIILLGCQQNPKALHTLQPPAIAATRPVDYPGLHNLVRYTDNIVSGSVPEGKEGFDSVRAMGIKTVISVDGAKPEIELAREAGIKYIHLPIGYNGFSQQKALEIARAVQVAGGPVYIHCHHGKHRSAGAAAAAAVTLGLLTNEEAIAKMKISGTAPAYKGLFLAAQTARPEDELLRAMNSSFPEVCTTSDLVDAMVGIDETMDLLKTIEKAGWITPSDHPDLVPAAEAGKLADQLRMSHGIASKTQYSQDFFDQMAKSSQLATSLEESLVAGNLSVTDLSARFKLVGQSCKDCHIAHRDAVVPQ